MYRAKESGQPGKLQDTITTKNKRNTPDRIEMKNLILF